MDTNILVAGTFELPGLDLGVASISWAELEYGVRKAASPIERAVRESRLRRLHQLFGEGVPFDDAAVATYGTICGLVLASGRDVRGRALDLMIAATAAANDAAVVTLNPKDFVGLEGFVEVIGL